MKYIKFRRELQGEGEYAREIPVIFPTLLTHSEVADALSGMEELKGYKVVSAGECNIFCSGTHGKSVTLQLNADGRDAALINGIDYSHGVVW